MTPSLLRQAGESLYGARWQSDLARDLGVNVRTVRRWAAGKNAMPSNVWTELRERMSERQRTLNGVLNAMPR